MSEPQQAEEPKKERRLEKEIEIDAPIGKVCRALTDALLWLTIEGLPNSIEVQAWLSAFAIDPSQIESFSVEWQQRLHEFFANLAVPEPNPG